MVQKFEVKKLDCDLYILENIYVNTTWKKKI